MNSFRTLTQRKEEKEYLFATQSPRKVGVPESKVGSGETRRDDD